MPQAIEIKVLGSVEVLLDGALRTVPGAKPRAILTMLGLNAGSVVPADSLQEILWGDDAPRTAHKALQTHISTLRHVLGDGVVLTSGSGWMLATEMVVAVDAVTFDESAQAGRNAMHGGAAANAIAHFSHALSVWRGLPQLPPTIRSEAEITRWAEARESVVDEWVDARLASGESASLVGELEKSLAAEPLREKRWVQLCLALYRSGRQGDALNAYQRARTVLIDELGLEPGPRLRGLEAAILQHDSSLDPHPAAPPAALSAPPIATLPSPPTTFIGRRDELTALVELLTHHRLVTVVGPGGVGKTRLALAAAEVAAHDYADHVWFVDLAAISPELVAEAVAGAVGISEKPDRPLDAAIAARLGVHRALLLLDNCDHVLNSVSDLAQRLISACPASVILATSRERLRVTGEQAFSVPPLSMTAPDEGGVGRSDAAALFVDRARAGDLGHVANPEHIAEVCARCDGLPLAIELAAARCASIGVDGLLAGLDDRLRILAGEHALNPRHRSLRAVLDWSHDLLSADEQSLFRRLGTFTGSFDVSAATAVSLEIAPATVIDVIGRLTDKNLLGHVGTATGSRWRMLDVVRSYAQERLDDSGDRDGVRGRYLLWATRTATRLDEGLTDGRPWRDEFTATVDDLRAALNVPQEEWPVDGDRLVLALALARLHARMGAFTRAQHAYEEAMAMARKTGDASQLAQAALGASEPGMLFGVTQTRRVALLDEALVALGSEVSGTRVRIQARLATELYWSSDQPRGRQLADEAATVAADLGDSGALAHALYALHYVTRAPGSTTERLALAERINRSAHLSGETQLELAGLAAHAVSLLEAGDLDAMGSDIAELAEAADRLDHPEFQWYVAVYRLVRALVAGRYAEADELATAATAAAEHAPEFRVGLYFAEAVTDLRDRDGKGMRHHAARLSEMADRFPRIIIWRCIAALNDLGRGTASDIHGEVRDLTAELLAQDIRDGHWLAACCLVSEAVAEISDASLAAPLATVLRPFEDQLAVAGRVAAFRGSVSHALGLLSATLGATEQAITDLTAATELHERIGARPFHARSVAALHRVRS